MTLVGGVLPRRSVVPLHEAVDALARKEVDFMLSQSVPEKQRRAFYQPSI